MRAVSYTKCFKRDYKREQSGIHGKRLDSLLMEIVDLLAADAPLPLRNRNHALSGEWNDCRYPGKCLVYGLGRRLCRREIAMGMTIIEKILARKSGMARVAPGDL